MSDSHFRAFSFVDRITSIVPGVRVSGRYTVPSTVTGFSPSLVAEAVGQLAAWAAMAAVGFKCRPVAGIAGRMDLLSEVRPGQTLELCAELETVDTDDVAYAGSARVGDVSVVRLHDCVGPMLPMADFDDPELVKGRYALLCDSGAAPGAFGGLPDFRSERDGGETGRWMRMNLQVPASAPFFADHFPRQPVFPGTLLMDANLRLATALVEQLEPATTGAAWCCRGVSDVKLRAFTPPGELLQLEARVARSCADGTTIALETRTQQRVVGGAQARFSREGCL